MFLLLLYVPLLTWLSFAYWRAIMRSVRMEPEARDGAIVLRYAGLMRASYVVTSALLLALSVKFTLPLVVGAANDVDLCIALAVVPFTLPGALFYFLESRVEMLVDEHGISARTAFRGRRDMPWSHVADSRYCVLGWISLRDRRGGVLRVPRALRGFHVLPEIARRNARVDTQEDLLIASEVWFC